MRVEVQNLFLIALGWFFFGLGVVGIFLPILPTTPFMILAAALFSKGSPRLHSWILRQKRIGPAIELWEKHRVIPTKAKALAIILILVSFSIPILFIPLTSWMKIALAGIGLSVIAFIYVQRSEVGETIETRTE